MGTGLTEHCMCHSLTESRVRDIVREEVGKCDVRMQRYVAREINRELTIHDQPKPDAEPQGVWVEPGDVVKCADRKLIAITSDAYNKIGGRSAGPYSKVAVYDMKHRRVDSWDSGLLTTLNNLPVLGVR